MDVQLYGFTRYSTGAVTQRADTIHERALELMADPTFADLIRHTISEQKRVERRFALWMDMLEDVMKDSEQGPRLFNRALKEELFKTDPTCAICKQKIQDIDDAHVDHKVAYSQGGKTAKTNAALAHRYCNLSKSAG